MRRSPTSLSYVVCPPSKPAEQPVEFGTTDRPGLSPSVSAVARASPRIQSTLDIPALQFPGHAARRVKLVYFHFGHPGRCELEFELYFSMLDHFPANDAGAPTPRPAEGTSRESRWQLANSKRFASFRLKSGQIRHENSRLVLTLIQAASARHPRVGDCALQFDRGST